MGTIIRRLTGDESAIFSFYLLDHYEGRKEPTRYTAEFIVSKYKHEKFVYKVRQIQAKADEGASKEAWLLLENYAEQAGEANRVSDPVFV